MNDEKKPFLEHDEFCVRLRFFGDELDPDELTSLLGAQPTEAHRRGDILRRPPSHAAPGGYWAIATERSTHDIEAQLTELFSHLTSDYDVWRSLTSRYEADLFCGVFISWFGHGFSMSPALHRALTHRNLLITFDIYPEYDRNA